MSIYNSLKDEFRAALPLWVERKNLLLVFEEVFLTKLSAIIDLLSSNSDFYSQDTAKENFQTNWSLYETKASINSFFKQKAKIQFARGSYRLKLELSRVLMSTVPDLIDTTVLEDGTVLLAGNCLIGSDNFRSGFILNSTFPNMDEESMQDYPELITDNFKAESRECISEPSYVLLKLTNNSNYSDSQIESIIRSSMLEAWIPSIIKFNSNA
jgi:hypothetical protein